MDDKNQPQNPDPNAAPAGNQTDSPVYPQSTPDVQPTQPQPQQPYVTLTEEQKFAQSQLPGNDKVNLKPKKKFKYNFSGAFGIFQLVIGALLLAFVINQFIFQSYQVFGESMTPTLNEGDRLIISKVSKTWNSLLRNNYEPSRGDIIVFESTLNDNVQLVKRVIGVPGDRVVVSEGTIVIYNEENPNGFNPDEDYDDDFAGYTTGNIDVIVGENQIFVSGDNRSPGGSLDSRNDLGLVPIDHVVGELVLRIFPLGDASFF